MTAPQQPPGQYPPGPPPPPGGGGAAAAPPPPAPQGNEAGQPGTPPAGTSGPSPAARPAPALSGRATAAVPGAVAPPAEAKQAVRTGSATFSMSGATAAPEAAGSTTAAPQVIDTAEMTIDMRRQAAAGARSEAEARAVAASAAAVDTPGVGLVDPQTQQPTRAIPDHLTTPPPRNARPLPTGSIAVSSRIHVGQLVTWQVAIAAIIFSLSQPLPIIAAVVIGAVAAIVISAGRSRRRWLYQWCAIWLQYLQRTRRRTVAADPTRRAAEVVDLLSSGAVLSAMRGDDQELGLIDHANGVSAVLELDDVSDRLVSDTLSVIPPPDVLLPTSEAGTPPVAIQLLVRAVPAPAPRPAANPVGESYQSVIGDPPTPIQRRILIAAQAIRTADEYEPAILRETAKVTARQVQRRLRKGNFPVRALTKQELANALLDFTDLAPETGEQSGYTPHPAAGFEIIENWANWRGRRTPHTCFRIRKWPADADPAGAPLFERLLMTPARANLISIATRQLGDQVEVETVVRTVAHDDAGLNASRQRLDRAAADCHGALEQLDGEQAYGVAATLPFGGFLQ